MSTKSKSVRDKIKDGDYKIKLPYPDRPEKPAGLAKRVEDVSAAEFVQIMAEKQAYEDAKVAYKAACATYSAESRILEDQFEADLAEEHGMTNHPKRSLLYSKAYENGHSGGNSEILCVYEDLVELVEAPIQISV